MSSELLPEGHPFAGLRRNGYGAILADFPWRYEVWSGETAVKRRAGKGAHGLASTHYETMSFKELWALPIADLAAENCILFPWITWPTMPQAVRLIKHWGFKYQTCGFSWMKATAKTVEMFDDSIPAHISMGHWTRSNSEVCLLATKGSPKRLHKDVRQGIIEPRREHSRKPDCIHGRIERLVAGPYCELFARRSLSGWDTFGDQKKKFDEAAA